MASNWDVQKRVSAEVDSAVPANRLPCLADIDSMPYLMATIKETLRWNPPLPLGYRLQFYHEPSSLLTVIVGVPHRNGKADTYNGALV
jgi:hypothetical protein